MSAPSLDAIVGDLRRVISPGLWDPRTQFEVLPGLQAVRVRITRSGPTGVAAAVEALVRDAIHRLDVRNRPTADAPESTTATALKHLLAIAPGSQRVTAGVRRNRAARALNLLTGDGFRSHKEPGLLRDLGIMLLELEVDTEPATGRDDPASLNPATIGDAGILRHYPDIIDVDEWERLFDESSSLDLVMTYGATWRHTYLKQLQALVARPEGRLRVILPDFSSKSRLVPLYANRLGMRQAGFRELLATAVSELGALRPCHHVELYATSVAFHHALYVFTRRAVLGLYALCGERIPSPAFLLEEGGLLEFVRLDVDRLLDGGSGRCWRLQGGQG